MSGSSGKKGNGNIAAFIYQNNDGSVSLLKVGIIAAAVAYTYFYNTMFLLALFEIFILFYFIVMVWRLSTGLLTSKA